MREIKAGDAIVSGNRLLHLVVEVKCEHIIVIENYYESMTDTSTLEFVGFMPIWRRKDDRGDASGAKAGGGLHLLSSDLCWERMSDK